MNHDQSVRELQLVVAPHRAAGWFVRHQLWCLGYWGPDGKKVELARGDGTTTRGTDRVLRDAIRAWRKQEVR